MYFALFQIFLIFFMFSRKLMDGLRCIDDFTTKCLDEDHRAYFNTLYTGTTQVIMDLCQTGDYQTGADTSHHHRNLDTIHAIYQSLMIRIYMIM